MEVSRKSPHISSAVIYDSVFMVALCYFLRLCEISGVQAGAKALSSYPTVMGAICFGCVFFGSEECCDPLFTTFFIIADKSSQCHPAQVRLVDDHFTARSD